MDSIFKNIRLQGDRIIWVVVFLLCVISILVVYSVEGISDVFKHVFRLSVGLIGMYLAHQIKFKYFSKIGVIIFWTSILLLTFGMLFFGVSINSAQRWIDIAGQKFQPSDVAKIAVILFTARQLSLYQEALKEFKGVLWYAIAPILLICLFVFPSDLSTAILIFVNGLILIYIAKVKIKYVLYIIGITLFSALFLYLTFKYVPISQKVVPRSATWISRVDSFFSPSEEYNLDEGYQSIQGKIAIHKGGTFGTGPGKSVQKHFLYASSSDFIFAIMIEEYGLVLGAIFPILLYLILLLRSMRIAIRSESYFGSLIAAGLAISLVFQAAINMSVATGVVPVTGQTLPLISMGGTSILFTCISIGIILSVSRDSSDRTYETA